MATTPDMKPYRDGIVSMLRDLVSYRSVKDESAAMASAPFGPEVDGAYRYMLERAKDDGFDVFDADGWGGHIEWAGAVRDERGEIVAAAEQTLGIPVHLDVVPPGDGWATDPWTLEERDGLLFGRGTSDDKGAAAETYFAMKALRDSGFEPEKNIRLILGLDEETGWSGMDRYLAQAPPPDFGFSPDGVFPVVNGEMGMLVMEIAKKLEPSRETGLHVRLVEGGIAPNMVPDACRAVLAYEDAAAPKDTKKGKRKSGGARPMSPQEDRAFAQVKEAAEAFRARTGHAVSCKGRGRAIEVSAQGRSAHGAYPESGLNAISVLMSFLAELPIANEGVREFVEFYCAHIGFETDGKGLGIQASDSLSGPLIVNAGQIQLSREAALLTLNVRNPVTRSEDDVYADLRPLIDAFGLGVVRISGVAPQFFPEDDPLVAALVQAYRENSGDMGTAPVVSPGGTYARAIPHAVAYGPHFPGRPEVMHRADEYISEDDMLRAAQIFADAIRRLTERA